MAQADNVEVNSLHAAAFDARVFDESEWNWRGCGFTPTNAGVIAPQDRV